MAAVNSKGITICMTPAKAQTANDMTITAVADTAVVGAVATLITATPQPAVGDVVTFPVDLGFPNLNGKSFVVTKLTSTTGFELGQVTAGTGTLKAGSKASHYLDTELVCLCLNSLSINADTPGTVSVATYCDPTATLPASVVSAGTLSFGGYVDVSSKDYPALLAAVDDNKQRIIKIMLPSNGYIIAPVTISQITWDLPLDGAVGFAGTASLGSKPRHFW